MLYIVYYTTYFISVMSQVLVSFCISSPYLNEISFVLVLFLFLCRECMKFIDRIFLAAYFVKYLNSLDLTKSINCNFTRVTYVT